MTLAASKALLGKVDKSVQAVAGGGAFFVAASGSGGRRVARTRPRARAEYLWQAGRALGIADTGRWNRASLTSRQGVSLNTPSKKGLHFHPRECVADRSLMQALVGRRALPAGTTLCPKPAQTPPVWIFTSLGWERNQKKKERKST